MKRPLPTLGKVAIGSRSMQLQLEHLNRTFALQSSETHCCRWPLSLQSSRWRATSSRRDDVSVWACGSSSILHCGISGLSSNFRFTAFSDSIRPIEHASATSCCLLDSQTWNRQGEGRREAGGRVCCTAERHAVSSLRSNLNKPDVNSQKHRDTSTACRYDSNSSLVTLLRHVDAFRQVICTNSRGGDCILVLSPRQLNKLQSQGGMAVCRHFARDLQRL